MPHAMAPKRERSFGWSLTNLRIALQQQIRWSIVMENQQVAPAAGLLTGNGFLLRGLQVRILLGSLFLTKSIT